uniref:Secreted protein n=1 Tax=Ascaris lumbricoides TaxID=6252 RepID=A0A0M3I3T5_ASCLU
MPSMNVACVLVHFSVVCTADDEPKLNESEVTRQRHSDGSVVNRTPSAAGVQTTAKVSPSQSWGRPMPLALAPPAITVLI